MVGFLQKHKDKVIPAPLLWVKIPTFKVTILSLGRFLFVPKARLTSRCVFHLFHWRRFSINIVIL